MNEWPVPKEPAIFYAQEVFFSEGVCVQNGPGTGMEGWRSQANCGLATI